MHNFCMFVLDLELSVINRSSFKKITYENQITKLVSIKSIPAANHKIDKDQQ